MYPKFKSEEIFVDNTRIPKQVEQNDAELVYTCQEYHETVLQELPIFPEVVPFPETAFGKCVRHLVEPFIQDRARK